MHARKCIRQRDGHLASKTGQQRDQQGQLRFRGSNCRVVSLGTGDHKAQLTARAAWASDCILSLGLLAVAVESVLVAAGAFGLRSADAGLAGAAAAGGWDCHDDGGEGLGYRGYCRY